MFSLVSHSIRPATWNRYDRPNGAEQRMTTARIIPLPSVLRIGRDRIGCPACEALDGDGMRKAKGARSCVTLAIWVRIAVTARTLSCEALVGFCLRDAEVGRDLVRIHVVKQEQR